jgi:hypothetical protein
MVLQVDGRAPEPALDDPLAIALQGLSRAGAVISGAMASLLDSLLYLPQYPEAELSQQDVRAGRLSLGVYQLEGRNFAPAFSSIEALGRFVKPGTAYAALPAKTLFDMWTDDWLMVNPASRYRLILSADEVHGLARGQLPAAIEIDSR